MNDSHLCFWVIILYCCYVISQTTTTARPNYPPPEIHFPPQDESERVGPMVSKTPCSSFHVELDIIICVVQFNRLV